MVLSQFHWYTKKTKEMLFGPILQNPPPSTVFDTGTIDRVTSLMLLGVIITDNLSWEIHINAVSAQTDSHLNFFTIAKTIIRNT
jgi:hypothetical protein